MRPVCLQLKGFTSFKEDTTVSFAHLDRFAVCGPTGAGKSSLFDALTFALFGKAPRVDTGTLVDLISLGRKSFSVCFDFSIAGRKYQVMRSRSRASGNQPDQLLELDKIEPLATGANAVTAAVEKLLGLTYVHFTQSVFLPQGKFAELLRSAPSVRRKLLNELLRLLVYERMREAAGQEREGTNARKEETERRLREDFANVSAEAQEELTRQLAAQEHVLADANRKLPELRLRWEEARCNHDWTTELDARQLELTKLAARQPEIDLAQREAEAAGRATEVVPLLDLADAAHKAFAERQSAFTEAGTARDQRKAEHDKARNTLEQANREGAPLPDLRERLQRLAQAVGKLDLCDQLGREIKLLQGRHEAFLGQQSTCTAALHVLTDAINVFEKDLGRAEAELALIGYDQDRHHRLEAVREDAFRLRGERERFCTALQQAEQDEARSEQAELAFHHAEEEEAKAGKARHQAQRKFTDAERRLRQAEDAHKAVHLRATLQPGQPCPVCLHKVGKLPADEPAPELEERQHDFDEARSRLTKAEQVVHQQAAVLTAARTAAENLAQQAQVSRDAATQRQQAVDLLSNRLQLSVGDLLSREGRFREGEAPAEPIPRKTAMSIGGSGSAGASPSRGASPSPAAMPTFLAWTGEAAVPAPRRRRKPLSSPKTAGPLLDHRTAATAVAEQEITRIEDGILASLQQAALQAEEHRRAAERLTELRNVLALKHKEQETLQADSNRLDQDLEKTVQKLGQEQQALAQTQAEIHQAAGTSDPVSESARVHQEIDHLQHVLAEAVQAEAEASKNWQIDEARATTCAGELAGARATADESSRHARQALARAGFADAAAARQAFRPPQLQQALRDRLAEHTAGLQSLTGRIAELEKSLRGRRVSQDECRQCEQAHNDCLQAKQQSQMQASLLTHQLATMGQQLQRAEQLQGELTRQEQLQHIFEQLARDLRSDNFQAFLLEETLAGLVRDASQQLLRLTGERYGLHFEDDRIFVVDNDNAAEHRGIETLSGGETFLASLALALALSEQVQKIAGAVHLDCLFIDEGFGALDPETLRTVSDTIRALQVGGRMVGVITHIPELKEEFDQRLVVERKEGTSQVRLEIC